MAFFLVLFGNMREASPGRERRETWFADDGKRKRKGKGAEGRESQDQQAPATLESADVVAEISQGFREQVSGIHTLDERMDKIVGSKELAELAEFEAGSGAAQDAFMHETLDDPERTTHLIRKLDDRIQDSRLFADALESRLKMEGADELKPLREEDRTVLLEALRSLREHVTAHIPATDIALLFSGTPRSIDGLTTDPIVAGVLKENPTDSWAIGQALQLEKRVPDEAERSTVLQTLIAAMNALTKKQNYGRAYRKEEMTEDWAAWRRDFVGELEEQSAILKERLKAQLEKKADAFFAAEKQREERLFRSLGLRAEDLEERTESERNVIVERACLMTHGVRLSAAHDVLLQRGDAVMQMMEKMQGADPENVCDRSAALLRMIKDFEEENDRFDPKDTQNFMVEQRLEQEEAERWTVAIGRKLRNDPEPKALLEQQLDARVVKLFERYVDGDPVALRGEYPDCIDASVFDAQLRETINGIIAMRPVMTPGMELKGERMRAKVHARMVSAPSPEELFDRATDKPGQIVFQVREQLKGIFEEILPSLNAPVCNALRVPQMLVKRWQRMDAGYALAVGYAAQILRGDEPRDALLGKMREEWAHAELQVTQLTQAKEDLATLATDIVEEDSIPHGETGYFDFADRKIHILRSLTGPKREEKIAHERGHGILHILRQEVLPVLLLSETEAAISKERTAGGEGFDALLERLADYYHIDDPDMREGLLQSAEKDFPSDTALAEKRARELRREYLLEELYSRYADWMEKGHPAPSIAVDDPKREAREAERELFGILQETARPPERKPTPASHTPRKGKMYTDDDGDTGDAENGGNQTTPATAESASQPELDDETTLQTTLESIKNNIKTINAFLDAYEDSSKPEIRQFVEIYRPVIEEYKKLSDDYMAKFKKKEPLSADEVNGVNNDTKAIVEEVRNFDKLALDIRGEKHTAAPSFWNNIQWVSINDLVKLWQDLKEDIKAIYTRNQQRTLEPLGNSIYDMVKDAAPYVPYFGGRYMSKLRGYHERRYAGAELEGADKWKKAMERWDTHQILHTLGSTRNLDQIRGCIELICDRGEMNWNDEGVWKTLMGITKYKMPIEACQRDDILRDVWLRKMISEVWKDKELYYKWRSNNDSATESHKKKYIQAVDQYSNVRGGLSGNLERQLRLYEEWKIQRDAREDVGLPPPPFPDDVKPHMYEEIIEYSIKNGKMYMEDKLYYIVQGVSSGLLPIERLRAMAGQHGSIIQFFPQIEYFYGHNNSLPEIKALAKRLTEHDNGKPTFTPGLKTTLWFHFEVARDPQVKLRLSKGSARNAEGYDHEDIPFAVTQMDYSEMSNMLNVISGGRQKVTPEGLKNAYVGFNSKMKIFGNLAKLERDNLERFTADDARVFAKSLAAYIFMDNTLTLNGKAVNNPPTLSLSQFKTVPPSAVDDKTAWMYRGRMTEFIRALNSAGIFNDITWGTDPDNKNALGVKKEEMLTVEKVSEENPEDGYQRNAPGSKILQEAVFPRFAEQLEKAIMKNMDAFKRVLADSEESFLNEGGSKDLTYELVKKIREDEAKERKDHTGNR